MVIKMITGNKVKGEKKFSQVNNVKESIDFYYYWNFFSHSRVIIVINIIIIIKPWNNWIPIVWSTKTEHENSKMKVGKQKKVLIKFNFFLYIKIEVEIMKRLNIYQCLFHSLFIINIKFNIFLNTNLMFKLIGTKWKIKVASLRIFAYI